MQLIKQIFTAKKKLVFALSILLLVLLSGTKVYAKTGSEYDPNLTATGSFSFPSAAISYSASFPGSVSYTLKSTVDSGYVTTVSGGKSLYYTGYTRLWLENYKGGGEKGLEASRYTVSVADKSPLGTSGTDSGSISYPDDLPDLITMTTSDPSCKGSVYQSNSEVTVSASATGGKKTGTANFEFCVYITDWFGMSDSDVESALTSTRRYPYDDIYFDVDVSSTDPIKYYYYKYDNNSSVYTLASGSKGSGDSFYDDVDISYAGKYCHVTFYTESGKSTSCVMKIPNAATLSYDANGGSPTPPSVTTWAGSRVQVTSTQPTRTNYTFLGWHTSSSYTELAYNASAPYGTYSAGSIITLDSDVTLYAVWRQIKVPYSTYFTINGKSVSNDFAYITGYVNGSLRTSSARSFSALETPGYTVYSKVWSSDENVYILGNGNSGRSPSYVYTTSARTINTDSSDTFKFGTIHTIHMM